MNNQFERVTILLGEQSLEKLQTKRVLVVGLGGVGSYAVESLVRSGVGSLTIVDYDVVDITNLNRQIEALHSTLGQKKTTALKERMLDINPKVEVDCYDLKLNENNIETLFNKKIDYVVDAIDDLSAKIILWQYCQNNRIPFVASLGMARKLDGSKLCVTTLNKTTSDPMARKLRYLAKKAELDLKIKVVWSQELTMDMNGKEVLGSMIFVPASAGLLCGQTCIEDLLRG